MRTLTMVFCNKNLLFTAIFWGWLEIAFLPNPMLIFCLFGAMLIDLITGLLKSWSTGKATTSTGFRKTVAKITMYFSLITATWILANLLQVMWSSVKIDYSPLVNLVIGILSFIELYSVFENVYAMAPNSPISRYVAKPFLKLLRGMLDRADK
ncbi:MAG: hypothetical protein EOP52_13420 [Sphingobacteriales bacterium]|nr:MAG: hypothetical protein EOP52_13420 [Sphingobacteriales bacterium]